MGYYASTSWSVTYRSLEDREACERTFREKNWIGESAPNILEAFGESSEVYDDNPLELLLAGYTGGKYYGDTEMFDVIAQHADGKVEIDASESGDGYELATIKDGKVYWSSGHIVYDYPRGMSRPDHSQYIAVLRGHGDLQAAVLADLLEKHDDGSLSLDGWENVKRALELLFSADGGTFEFTPNGM
jgi:hypothetical protein